MKNWILLLPIIFLSVACSKKTYVQKPVEETETSSSDVNFDKFGSEMCDCAEPILTAVKKLEELSEAGDAEGAQALASQFDAKIVTMEKCIDDLAIKYPTLDKNPENEEKAMAAIKKHCPEFAKIMEEG